MTKYHVIAAILAGLAAALATPDVSAEIAKYTFPGAAQALAVALAAALAKLDLKVVSAPEDPK